MVFFHLLALLGVLGVVGGARDQPILAKVPCNMFDLTSDPTEKANLCDTREYTRMSATFSTYAESFQEEMVNTQQRPEENLAEGFVQHTDCGYLCPWTRTSAEKKALAAGHTSIRQIYNLAVFSSATANHSHVLHPNAKATEEVKEDETKTDKKSGKNPKVIEHSKKNITSVDVTMNKWSYAGGNGDKSFDPEGREYALFTPPNIIFILVDDLGTGDVNWNGEDSEYLPWGTPAFTRDAVRNGITLTDHHMHSWGTPSRGALLTGRFSSVLGLDRGGPLGLDEYTLAQEMRSAGYKTQLVGKWGLGWSSALHLPTSRGFDYHFGYYSREIDPYTKEIPQEAAAPLRERNYDGPLTDLWENGRPYRGDSLSTDDDKMLPFLLQEKVQHLIRHHGSEYQRKIKQKNTARDVYDNEAKCVGSGCRRRDERHEPKTLRSQAGLRHLRSRRLAAGNSAASVAAHGRSDNSDNKAQGKRNREQEYEDSKTKQEDKPLFLMYPTNLVRAPHVAPRMYTDRCRQNNSAPGYEEWVGRCAQLLMLNEVIQNTTCALDAAGLTNNTLIVLASDNGGANNKAVQGTNGGLRGGKYEYLQGGTKAVAALYGGIIPQHLRGKKYNGLMHVTDWLPTLMHVATNGQWTGPYANSAQAKNSTHVPGKKLHGKSHWRSIMTQTDKKVDDQWSPTDNILNYYRPASTVQTEAGPIYENSSYSVIMRSSKHLYKINADVADGIWHRPISTFAHESLNTYNKKAHFECRMGYQVAADDDYTEVEDYPEAIIAKPKHKGDKVESGKKKAHHGSRTNDDSNHRTGANNQQQGYGSADDLRTATTNAINNSGQIKALTGDDDVKYLENALHITDPSNHIPESAMSVHAAGNNGKIAMSDNEDGVGSGFAARASEDKHADGSSAGVVSDEDDYYDGNGGFGSDGQGRSSKKRPKNFQDPSDKATAKKIIHEAEHENNKADKIRNRLVIHAEHNATHHIEGGPKNDLSLRHVVRDADANFEKTLTAAAERVPFGPPAKIARAGPIDTNGDTTSRRPSAPMSGAGAGAAASDADHTNVLPLLKRPGDKRKAEEQASLATAAGERKTSALLELTSKHNPMYKEMSAAFGTALLLFIIGRVWKARRDEGEGKTGSRRMSISRSSSSSSSSSSEDVEQEEGQQWQREHHSYGAVI